MYQDSQMIESFMYHILSSIQISVKVCAAAAAAAVCVLAVWGRIGGDGKNSNSL